MPSINSIALSGMNAAQTNLQASAHNIANLGTEGFRRERVAQQSVASGGVDTSVSQSPEVGDSMATDVVGLLQAKNAFLANLAVFRTGDRVTRSLLEIVG